MSYLKYKIFITGGNSSSNTSNKPFLEAFYQDLSNSH